MPLYYNDHSPIEPAKFLTTKNELVSEFGGCTALTPSPGTWIDPVDGTVYDDINAGFYADTDETKQILEWLAAYKETLKHRFQQKEISITYTEINPI